MCYGAASPHTLYDTVSNNANVHVDCDVLNAMARCKAQDGKELVMDATGKF